MDADLLTNNDVNIEEGELSDTSDEVYIPLQRPVSLNYNASSIVPTEATDTKCTKMDADPTDEYKTTKDLNNVDEDECQSDDYSSSSSSSDTCLNNKIKNKHKKRHVKRTVMVRIHPTSDTVEQKKTHFKKYDIWTAALQEDALTENMRGCDVTQNSLNDRNVENYNFRLRYRLNGENSLKRRLSTSNDDLSDSDHHQPQGKRHRPLSRCVVKTSSSSPSSFRRAAHERLGKRREFRGRRRSSSLSANLDSNFYEPKHIEDLDNLDGREPVEIAREIALKLHEEKYDLLERVIEVLGIELPLKIFKETQRIEAEGGMTIQNGQRRRTPGGVFLFLLKHHDSLTSEHQKAIFAEDRNNADKKHKNIKMLIRDRKVEELKKRLCEQSAELPSLNVRKELLIVQNEVNQKQNDGNLSNPPPSPEAYEQIELDLKSMPINHVANDVEEEKPSTSRGAEVKILHSYEDDFLDVNCGDMDFF